jgi:hypothetical protein
MIATGAERCGHCGLPLTKAYRESAKNWTGPWFVFSDRNPSGPGYNIKAIHELIKKGKVTKASVVRGPTTNGEWCLAARTPGISKYLGICWKCQDKVSPKDTVCTTCMSNLDHSPHKEAVAGKESPLLSELAMLIESGPEKTEKQGHQPIRKRRKRKKLAPLTILLIVSNAVAIGGLLIATWFLTEKAPPAVPSYRVQEELKKLEASQHEPADTEVVAPHVRPPMPRGLEQAWRQAKTMAESDDINALWKAYRLLSEIEKETTPAERPASFKTILEDVKKRIAKQETGDRKNDIEKSTATGGENEIHNEQPAE